MYVTNRRVHQVGKLVRTTLESALRNWRVVLLDLLRLFCGFFIPYLGCSDGTILYAPELYQYAHIGAPFSNWNGPPE